MTEHRMDCEIDLDAPHLTPEQNLWRAVLTDAIRLVRRKVSVRSQQKTPPVTPEELWIASRDTRVASFVWVCNHLNINPESARRLILRDDNEGRYH